MARMTESVKEPSLYANKSIEMPKPAESPQYALIIQNEVSSALKVSPDSIRGQLRQGKHLSDIAAARGVSEDELKNIETVALTDATNAAFKGDSEQSKKMLEQLKGNSQVLDRIVSNAFYITR